MKLKDKKIYYINMDKHVDRRKRIESIFDQHGFTDVTRVAGVVDDDPIVGCAKAYLSVFDQAPDSDFIILEDDCVTTEWFDPNLQMDHFDVDALYLGISLWSRVAFDPYTYDWFEKYGTTTLVEKIIKTLFMISCTKDGKHPYYKRSGPFLNKHEIREDGTMKIDNMLSTHAIYYKSKQMVSMTRSIIEETVRSSTPRHIDCLFAEILQNNLEIRCLINPQFYQSSSSCTYFTMKNYEEYLEKHLDEWYIDRNSSLFDTILPNV